MLKLIAIQSNGDEEEGDGDEEEGNEIKDNDHSNPYYCFSDLPEGLLWSDLVTIFEAAAMEAKGIQAFVCLVSSLLTAFFLFVLCFKNLRVPIAGLQENILRTLRNTTKENETLLAIGTAFVQGEDVAARGHVLLFSVDRNPDNLQTLVPEVYSKELKGAISALASLQGHLKGAMSALASLQSLLLIASGPKISWF